MMHSVMLWCIKYILKWTKCFDCFCMNPKLIQQIELLMSDEMCWWDEKCHWEVKYLKYKILLEQKLCNAIFFWFNIIIIIIAFVKDNVKIGLTQTYKATPSLQN